MATQAIASATIASIFFAALSLAIRKRVPGVIERFPERGEPAP